MGEEIRLHLTHPPLGLELRPQCLLGKHLVARESADATGAAADGALGGEGDTTAVGADAAGVAVLFPIVLELLGREEV